MLVRLPHAESNTDNNFNSDITGDKTLMAPAYRPANGRDLMKLAAPALRRSSRLRFHRPGADAEQKALKAIGDAIPSRCWSWGGIMMDVLLLSHIRLKPCLVSARAEVMEHAYE